MDIYVLNRHYKHERGKEEEKKKKKKKHMTNPRKAILCCRIFYR